MLPSTSTTTAVTPVVPASIASTLIWTPSSRVTGPGGGRQYGSGEDPSGRREAGPGEPSGVRLADPRQHLGEPGLGHVEGLVARDPFELDGAQCVVALLVVTDDPRDTGHRRPH